MNSSTLCQVDALAFDVSLLPLSAPLSSRQPARLAHSASGAGEELDRLTRSDRPLPKLQVFGTVVDWESSVTRLLIGKDQAGGKSPQASARAVASALSAQLAPASLTVLSLSLHVPRQRRSGKN